MRGFHGHNRGHCKKCSKYHKGGFPVGHQYGKGRVPWNKGMKGLLNNTGRTRFKKGQPAWNKEKKLSDHHIESLSVSHEIHGLNNYRKKIFKNKKTYVCEYCKKRKYINKLHIHHKDKNRQNNKRDNLIVCCRKCHVQLHGGHYDKRKTFKRI